jgi:hypothetical protein
LLQEQGGGEAAIQSAILRAQERALAAELAEVPARPAAGARRIRRLEMDGATESSGQLQVPS